MIPQHSTVLTVIKDLVSANRRLGGRDSVVVATERANDRLAPEWITPASPFRFPYDRKRELGQAIDHVTARLARHRPFGRQLWSTALEGVDLSAFDHVVVHDASFAHASIRAVERAGARTIWLYSHVAVSRSVSTSELRWLADRVDGWIFVSDALKRSTEARLGAASAKFYVVHNGVDPGVFSPTEADRTAGAVILAAGLNSQEKGLDRLLAALPLIRTADWTARFAGGGWYDTTGSRPEQTTSSIEQVGFLPHTEMPDFLRAGRVFVFPSRWEEPFGLGLLEAMACGLACITTRRGGIPEVGQDAVLYVDGDDPAELAATIDMLLGNEQLARDLGNAARARALELSVESQYDAFRRCLAE